MSDYLPLPKTTERIKGQKYMHKNEIVIWGGKRLLCEHGKQRNRCKECGGGSICEHDERRSQCKVCDPNGYLTSLHLFSFKTPILYENL